MTTISVIVPTVNRCVLLERMLASLRNQSLDNELFEIIVVDNGSTDNTFPMVETARRDFVNLRYLFEPSPGLHAARHAGARVAQGEILVFADDDIEAFPDWLAAVRQAFSDEETLLVGGKILPAYEMRPPSWLQKLWVDNELGRCLGYLSLMDFGDQTKMIPPGYVWGCNFSIRKKTLFQLGGFHPDAMPQDMLIYRGDGESAVTDALALAGGSAVYSPAAAVYHFVPASRMTLEYFYKRAYAQGISASYARIRSENMTPPGARTRAGMVSFLCTWNEFAAKLREKLFMAPTGPDNERSILSVISKGYQDGFRFHQYGVRKDKELLRWVLKESYWE